MSKTKFTPGVFKVGIAPTQIINLDEDATFTHSFECSDVLLSFLESETIDKASQLYRDFGERQLRDVVDRAWYLALGKKFATATSPRDEPVRNFYSRLASFSFEFWSGLGPAVDGFGSFENGGLTYRPRGVGTLVSTYMVRALGPEHIRLIGDNGMPPLSRKTHVVLNTSYEGWKSDAIDFFSGVVSGWAQHAPVFECVIGDLRTFIRPPEFRGGATAYLGLIANAPGLPLKVTEALNVVRLLESFEGADVPDQVVAQLLGLGVLLVFWDRNVMQRYMNEYLTEVQGKIRGVGSFMGGWGPLARFGMRGCDWQALTQVSESAANAPLSISGGSMDVGWVFAAEASFVTIPRAAWLQVFEKTRLETTSVAVHNAFARVGGGKN